MKRKRVSYHYPHPRHELPLTMKKELSAFKIREHLTLRQLARKLRLTLGQLTRALYRVECSRTSYYNITRFLARQALAKAAELKPTGGTHEKQAAPGIAQG